ncbi:MAG: SGNH/GDSL hydrolase family protein [Oscillospiraceae bacterium]|nr:SGNH/GDSL hydrolase family protein [Oscillospiraceae bacterium]
MRNKKRLAKVLGFLLVLGILFTAADKVLIVKYPDGIYSMQRFYELEDDTVDVLFLGSSHAFESFNTAVLWDDYGIAAYVLGGEMQPTWNTYYYLKEALKTQSPELIVIEGYECWLETNTNKYPQQIKNTYGMKPSWNKLCAMAVSSDYQDVGFFFPLSQYASRYHELTKADFLPAKGDRRYEDWMGFGSNHAHLEFDTLKIETDETLPMAPKTERYYRMILQLAQEAQIPIVVVVAPYPQVGNDQICQFNTAEQIAESYGVPFWDYASDPAAIGLDFSLHAADHSHLNDIGNRIFTHVVADRLKETFAIDDHRGDPAYASWERGAAYLDQLDRVVALQRMTDLSDVCDEIGREHYDLFLLTSPKCTNAAALLAPMRIERLNAGRTYLVSKDASEIILPDPSITYQDIYLRYHDDLVYSDRRRLSETYTVNDGAVKVIVYDTITDDIADVFSVYESDPTHVYR